LNKEIFEVLETISKDYYGVNYYDNEEVDAAVRVIKNKSPFRYYGEHLEYEVEKLEKECSRFFGVKNVHAVNSATGALSCALHALDITVGDEVIIPGYFWIAVANVCLIRGAIPVLCEVDESLNIDLEDLEKKVTSRTKCVIAIHMDGAQANIKKIKNFCLRKGLKLIEDFSQCMGGKIGNQMIGSFGDIAVASTQINKLVTAGEGGLILTNDNRLYHKMVAKSDFGFPRNEAYIEQNLANEYITYGEGRRCNEITAAILRVQLRRLPNIVETMQKTKQRIVNSIGDIYPIQYRKQTYEDEEIGTTLILLFPTINDAMKMMEIYRKNFLKDELKMYLLSTFGYHVYYNCLNLTNKLESLPTGFPWKYVDSTRYNYERGTLPKTDDILARAVGIKLPARLSSEQEKAISVSLQFLISCLRCDQY